MSDAPRPSEADRQWIDDLLDGRSADAMPGDNADNDVLGRFERDPAAIDYLLERAALHAGLRRALKRRSLVAWAMPKALEDAAAEATPRRRAKPILAWIALASCLVLALAAWQTWSRPYATVITGVGTTSLGKGATVRSEPHELAAGVLEFETQRGAQVVIEAPAAFHFESTQRLIVTKGRVATDVPPTAKGFTVVTPSGEAVDLGTRFAVDVPISGSAEIHVFDGEVVARNRATAPRSLRDGEAFSLAAAESREIRTAAFIRKGEVPLLAKAVAAGQETRSRSATRQLRDDPALIAFVDFEEDGMPPLGSTADNSGGPTGQYRIVQGRWPGSRAADFTNVGDYLPLGVGGDAAWPQLTIAAWVRLDRLGAPYQSLYHTDDWTNRKPGQVHWMIAQAGVMRLALATLQIAPESIERQAFPESRTSVLGAEGRWMHLAFVYDCVAKTASFYVDGRPDGVTALVEAPPARLGSARVGNWNRQDRTLSGRIDEIAILGRGLSADEVRNLYEAGVPYR